MKIAIVGAGALGSVYGTRLARRGGVDVTFVVRAHRVAETTPIVIEAVRRNAREVLERPERSSSVPPDSDAILLTVGTEDIESVRSLLGRDGPPILILTPMLPKAWSSVRETFGDRALAVMPSVIAYARKEDGVVRYWLPPAPTKIDEPRSSSPHAATVREVTAALSRAGLRATLELGVHETNPATTVCFIAIGMALSLAPSAHALAEDDALLSTTTNACREGTRLARRLGEPELWASFAPLFAAPWALRTSIHALERLAPEVIYYAEEHFGRKLHAQNRAMAHEMVELATERGLPSDALAELATRLDASSPA